MATSNHVCGVSSIEYFCSDGRTAKVVHSDACVDPALMCDECARRGVVAVLERTKPGPELLDRLVNDHPPPDSWYEDETNPFEPDMKTAIHPGEYLRDELKERGWLDVLDGNAPITPKIAVALARAFGQRAETWMILQLAYDKARATPPTTEEIRAIDPLKGSTKSSEQMVREVRG